MNNVHFNISLTTNFQPNNFINLNDTKIFKNRKKVVCKNFFLFILLIKYKNKNFFNKSSFFIKPFKKKIYTVLRPPYKNKLSRHQFLLQRYEIAMSIKIILNNNIIVNNYNSFLKIFKKINFFNGHFESNIISNHRIKTSFNLSYENNFKIKNFFRPNKISIKNK